MNCANHPAVSNVAFCRTCGKPLCGNCTRDVQGVIYCENCLAERLHGIQPPPQPTVYQQVMDQGAGLKVPPTPFPGPGPNPALAGILSIFPGVGTVYCGQYVKGLAYMGIFVFLILGTIHISGLIFGLSLGFFCVYQMIDAIRTAKAIQMGEPIPDPLGLVQTFGTGEPTYPAGTSGAASESTEAPRLPTGAVILIGLGVLFLLQTAGFLGEFSVDRLWPLILIALGVWIYAKRQGLIGTRYRRDGRPRNCSVMGPAILITLGVLFLVESFDGPSFFGHTWPVLLLVIGAVKLLEGKNPPPPPLPPVPPAPGTGTSSAAPAGEVSSPSSEVNNG
jgi:hypothetical protein